MSEDDRHGQPSLEELRALPAGRGGEVRVVTGGNPPYYAGLRRAPAESALEAALTFLVTPAYRQVVVFTGTGTALPRLDLGGGFRVGVVPGAFLLRGAGEDDGTAEAPATPPDGDDEDDDDFLSAGDLGELLEARDQTRVVTMLQHAAWTSRLEELLGVVADRAGFDWAAPRGDRGSTRTLVVIDDSYLGIDAARISEEDPPSAYRQRDLEERFERLPDMLLGSATDLVVVCEGRARGDGLREGDFLARFAGDLGEAEKRTLRRFPSLRLPCPDPLPLPGDGGTRVYGLEYRDLARGRALRDVLSEEVPAPPSGPLESLQRLVGMDSVKQQVKELAAGARLDAVRRREGLPVASDQGLHTVLLGNPGVGKTTVARILAGLYAELGLLPSNRLVEVTRADLVAEYVGQTAPRTREVCERALGGVLFIDEAYGLARGGPEDFGKEAIEELLRWMSERRGEIAVIAAGYPEPMRTFLRANEGFARRFQRHIHFPDYSDDELVEVARRMAAAHHDLLEDGVAAVLGSRLRAHREACLRAGQQFGNAGEVEKLLQGARAARSWRLREELEPTREQLVMLTVEDVREARLDVPGGPR